ncbi:MAG: hypothetical protein EGR89_12130 [[Eubacterium] rectale]|nr:hypothetical protein [Agathobacter rectalis]
MEKLKKQFELINSIDNQWVNIVKQYIKDSDVTKENRKILDEFNILFKILIECYKKNKNEVEKICSDFLKKSDTEWLCAQIINSLKPYFAFEFVREWQKNEEKKNCFEFVDYVFQNVILRFDPECAINYCNEKKITTDTFIEASKMLDGMVSYYIKQHYSHEAIVKDFNRETDLDMAICEYISSKIDDKYINLQLNVLIDSYME